MAPTLAELKTLEKRAHFLDLVRSHFRNLDVLEVDCPALSLSASIDAHIDPMHIPLANGNTAYLHTSPEYAMKRLLAKQAKDIYFLGHVFRDNEDGPLHTTEFTMIEWYRCNISPPTFIEETLTLIKLFLGDEPTITLTYQDAFLHHTQLDPLTAKTAELAPLAKHPDAHTWDKDTLLQLLFTLHVEPTLQDLTVITNYPASQAALARVQGDIAERFEIYYKGIELANGFHELSDAPEQRTRLTLENKKRLALGKSSLPLDEAFLSALPNLPDCCGVAAGFDRLLMLAMGHPTIHSLLP